MTRHRAGLLRQQGRRLRQRGLLLLPVLMSFGCASPVGGLFPPAAGEPRKTVYVIRHGWHTGVAVRVGEVPPDALPVLRDFPGADHVEFGWGDDAFYRAPRPTTGMALKAALWPTPSVLHVAGWQGSPREKFPASDIAGVELSARGLERPAAFIDKTFDRCADGRLLPLQEGLYGESRFYRARGKFYFPKMQLVDRLRAAGGGLSHHALPRHHRRQRHAADAAFRTRRPVRRAGDDPGSAAQPARRPAGW